METLADPTETRFRLHRQSGSVAPKTRADGQLSIRPEKGHLLGDRHPDREVPRQLWTQLLRRNDTQARSNSNATRTDETPISGGTDQLGIRRLCSIPRELFSAARHSSFVAVSADTAGVDIDSQANFDGWPAHLSANSIFLSTTERCFG